MGDSGPRPLKTAYVTPGTLLRCRGYGKSRKHDVEVCGFPPRENHISLRHGDLLRSRRTLTPAVPRNTMINGNQVSPAVIGCTIPEILDDVKAGEHVWFDDGKIGGIVEGKMPIRASGYVSRIRTRLTAKLAADKGINLPESKLDLPALTPNDIPILEFIAENADIAALSFANTAGRHKIIITAPETHGQRTSSR